MPHNGTQIPPSIHKSMTPEALTLKDTDWFMDKLYDFAFDKGPSILTPLYSRYVIDLNRDPHGEELYKGADNTALCPLTSFERHNIYQRNEPSSDEVQQRLEKYYFPYHHKIAQWIEDAKNEFGFALIYDAHSIKSQLPRFFEGTLPDLNLGTASGQSCHPELQDIVFEHLIKSPYDAVCNDRFKGGYITRHYGNPAVKVFTLQMEISQACYLNETDFSIDNDSFLRLQSSLKELFNKIITWVKHYGQL